MIRDRLSRRRQRDAAELNITAFLNLMVILVPFLLITAVFTRMAVLEMNVPAPSDQTEEQEDKLRLEVVVRDDALVVGDGRRIIEEVPRLDDGGDYDYERLSALMQELKDDNPDMQQASVLLEEDTKYDVIIQVMDAVRSAEVADPDAPRETRSTELFPEIALGDAP